jgi:uncharacterized membrane protein YvlD (DUF360 family)
MNISSLLFITYFFSGFKISQTEVWPFILMALLLAMLNYFLDPIVKFFTLKIKFPTIWLFSSLLYAPLIYCATLFPWFTIKAGNFKSIDLGIFQVKPFVMTDIVTVLISAAILGFGAAFIRWLMDK